MSWREKKSEKILYVEDIIHMNKTRLGIMVHYVLHTDKASDITNVEVPVADETSKRKLFASVQSEKQQYLRGSILSAGDTPAVQ